MKKATIEKTEKRKYVIQFPESYPLTKEKLEELRNCNPDLQLEITDNNHLDVIENTFLFEEYGTINLKLPRLTAELFEELHELNNEINFEFDDNEEVFIKMAIFRFIGRFTAKVLASFVNWASSLEEGEVYADPTGYELDDKEHSVKKIQRIPDVSFISYETASEETQDSWNGFIPIPPNMAMEIVSAKRGLKGDLEKMQNVWMATGVDVGIVVCPFSETIYIFEKGSTGYRSQSIYENFSHPLLHGYSENYGKFLKKGK